MSIGEIAKPREMSLSNGGDRGHRRHGLTKFARAAGELRCGLGAIRRPAKSGLEAATQFAVHAGDCCNSEMRDARRAARCLQAWPRAGRKTSQIFTRLSTAQSPGESPGPHQLVHSP